MRRIRTSPRPLVAALALLTASVAVALGTSGAAPGSAEAADGARPNIVMIVTDDQRLDEFTKDVMPATARMIAGRGTVFSNAIVTTPTCCPSRATILTGQYGHNNGVLANSPGYRRLIDPRNVLPAWLSRAGYTTAHLGKFLNGYQGSVPTRSEVAPGWDQWYTMLTPRRYYGYTLAVNGGEQRFGRRAKDHLTHVLNRQTAGLIKRYSRRDNPFYIQLDHFAPHTENGRSNGPSRCQGRSVPDPRDNKAFRDVKLPKPPSFNERDVSTKPSFVRTRQGISKQGKKKLKRRHRCRLASIRSVDRGVKRIVKTLRQEGALGNTVIIFLSDNGYFRGEHRIAFNKVLPYDEALRVPLAIRAPAGVTGGEQRQRVVGKHVGNLDLAPTILELAGAEPCTAQGCRVMDGRSLVELLHGNGNGFPEDRGLAVEYSRSTEKDGFVCEYSGMRTLGWSYMRYSRVAVGESCEPIEETELYDLQADPFQLRNLFSPNGIAGAPQQQLEARLARLRDCAGIAGRDPQPESGSYCE